MTFFVLLFLKFLCKPKHFLDRVYSDFFELGMAGKLHILVPDRVWISRSALHPLTNRHTQILDSALQAMSPPSIQKNVRKYKCPKYSQCITEKF